jgi:hypothetical protein
VFVPEVSSADSSCKIRRATSPANLLGQASSRYRLRIAAALAGSGRFASSVGCAKKRFAHGYTMPPFGLGA